MNKSLINEFYLKMYFYDISAILLWCCGADTLSVYLYTLVLLARWLLQHDNTRSNLPTALPSEHLYGITIVDTNAGRPYVPKVDRFVRQALKAYSSAGLEQERVITLYVSAISDSIVVPILQWIKNYLPVYIVLVNLATGLFHTLDIHLQIIHFLHLFNNTSVG